MVKLNLTIFVLAALMTVSETIDLDNSPETYSSCDSAPNIGKGASIDDTAP